MGEIILREVEVDSTVLSKSDVATYAIVTRPLSSTAQKGQVPAGTSLQELADKLVPNRTLQNFLSLFLGGDRIDRDLWPRVRLRPGAHVVGRVVPKGGGSGKNPFRFILQLVVAIAAIVISVYAGPLAAALFTIGANLLLNVIAPVKPPKLPDLSGSDQGSPTYSVSGSRNQARPFGVVPLVLGRHRMTPPLGALPFTEVVGDDQYLWQLFVWGHGPLLIEDIRIGQTPLDNFQDIEHETIEGGAGSEFQTLNYPDVFEEQFQILIENFTPTASLGPEEGWSDKVSEKGPRWLSVDLYFPQGLIDFDKDDTDPIRRDFQVRYRREGLTPWTTINWSITHQTVNAFRRNQRWSVEYDPEFRYEVQVRMTSVSLADTTANNDTVYWTTLRTIAPTSPVLMEGLCMTIVRIRATKQLNGVIDQLNGVATSILPILKNGNWSTREPTQNPAAHFRAIVQGVGNARPLVDSKIHIADIEAFYEDCVLNGYKFNMVRDFQTSVWETLQDVCAAALASPGHRDGKWTVIMDRPQDTPTQMFTPRNSSNFKGTIVYDDPPHGFRVRFINELKDFDQDEFIVYADGFSDDNALIFEGLELPGVTHPDLIWILGRFQLAQRILRGEQYTFQSDLEHLVCTRGDLILCAHDVPAWAYNWGRIKAIITSGSQTTGLILDERIDIVVGQEHRIRVRKSDGQLIKYDIDSTIAGEHKTITLTPPVETSTGPQVEDLFTGGVSGEETKELLVLSIRPGRDMGATVVCVDYAPDVYTAHLGPIPEHDSGIVDPPGIGYPVIQGIRSDENVMVRNNDGTLSVRVVLNFAFISNRTSDTTGIEIQARRTGTDDEAWDTVSSDNVVASNVSLEGFIEREQWDFRARYVFSGGNYGDWSPIASHTIVGKTTRPPKPTNARIEGVSDNRFLKWDLIDPPIDVVGYYIEMNEGNDINQEHSISLHPGIWSDSPFPIGNQGTGEKTFLIFTVDAGGFTSEEPAFIIVNLGQPINGDDVDAFDYKSNNWPGHKINATEVVDNLEADSQGDDFFWTGADTDFFWEGDDSDAFWTTGTYLEMTYEFSYQPDPAWIIQDVQVYTAMTGVNLIPTMTWAKSSLFWTGLDADLFWTGSDSDLFWDEEWDGRTYLPWTGSTNDVTDDLYVFRFVNPAGENQASITALKAAMRAPVVSEDVENLVIATPAGTRVPLTKSYGIIRSVPCDIQEDGNGARSVIVVDKNPSLGPLLKAYNAAGTQVAAVVDAHVRGN